MAPSAEDAQAKQFTPPAEKASIYLTRGHPPGTGIVYDTLLDGRFAGWLGPDTYQLFQVAPGEHTLAIRSPTSADQTNLTVEAGKTYFYHAGTSFPSSRLQLKALTEENGRKAVTGKHRAADLAQPSTQPPLVHSAPDGRRFLDAGLFEVSPPDEKGWLTRVNIKKNTVRFEKPGATALGAETDTVILVFLNGVLPEKGPVTEEQTADEYRNLEEQSMKAGAQRGEYKLASVQKGMQTIGDKKLYTLRYKTTKGHIFPNIEPATALEAVLYVYFPPDFAAHRHFFSILITEAYARGSFVSVDLSQVEPVIKSLRLKEIPSSK